MLFIYSGLPAGGKGLLATSIKIGEFTGGGAAAAAVKDVAGAGSVVLCHDGRTQPSEDLFSALEGGLRSLLERGLTVTTGSDLLASA